MFSIQQELMCQMVEKTLNTGFALKNRLTKAYKFKYIDWDSYEFLWDATDNAIKQLRYFNCRGNLNNWLLAINKAKDLYKQIESIFKKELAYLYV